MLLGNYLITINANERQHTFCLTLFFLVRRSSDLNQLLFSLLRELLIRVNVAEDVGVALGRLGLGVARRCLCVGAYDQEMHSCFILIDFLTLYTN